MDDNCFNTKGAFLIFQIFSVQREITMETSIGTISATNKHVPCTCKVNGGHVGCEMLDLIYNALCTWGQIWLTARLRKTNERSQTKRIVPYRLFHSPAHLPQSQCLPSCHFISVNSPQPQGYDGGGRWWGGGCWKRTPTFSEMQRRMNGSH